MGQTTYTSGLDQTVVADRTGLANYYSGGQDFTSGALSLSGWFAAAAGTAAADDVSVVGIANDPVIPALLAGAVISYDASQRIFATYTLTNPATKQIYIGRTSGYGTPQQIANRRYLAHHMRLFGFGTPTVDRAVQGYGGYPAIRGREQQLIDYFGGVGSPAVANVIRGVSRFNPAGRIFHEESDSTFGPLAPYTGYY